VIALLLVAVTAAGVAATRDTTRQAIVFGAHGMALTLLFLTFHAPGVAMAEAAVSGVVLPLLVLLALAKVRSGGR
jgi:energy-converting hydrogenase B subunit D